jgi:hypothetical protein
MNDIHINTIIDQLMEQFFRSNEGREVKMEVEVEAMEKKRSKEDNQEQRKEQDPDQVKNENGEDKAAYLSMD